MAVDASNAMLTRTFFATLLCHPLDNVSVLPALRRALNSLSDVFTTIGDKYQTALEAGDYTRFEEKQLDKEWLRKFKEEGEKKKAAAAAQ